MDFSVEDRFNFAAYNRILWKGLMGDQPYPAAPTGLDLRQNRDELLLGSSRTPTDVPESTKGAIWDE